MNSNSPIAQAERITKLTIASDGKGFWSAIGDNNRHYDVHAKDAKQAAERIVDLNWREVSKRVMRRQNWKCLHCAMIRPLQCHHVKFRSHGRLDIEENCVALCNDCHGREHGA